MSKKTMTAAETRIYLNTYSVAYFHNSVAPAIVAFNAVKHFRNNKENLKEDLCSRLGHAQEANDIIEMWEEASSTPLGL